MNLGFRVLVCVLSCIYSVNAGRRIPNWHLSIAQKQGPNACVVEEVPGTPYKLWTECRYWLTRKVCGQKTLIRYECCEGYERVNGTEGCTGVKPLKNVIETARELGATEFVKFIEESGLQKEWTNTREGAFTIFAPTNEAFSKMTTEFKNRLESYRNNIENPILKYHVLDKKIVSDSFLSDMMVPTLYDGQRVRINKYSNGMLTVNCVLIVRKDQEATNGVVHLIDSVLDPSQFINKDVADIVMADGRFNVLSQAMEEAAFVNKIRSAGQVTFTIFSPSDEAFEKITPQRRRAIMNDKEARSALLQNHVLPHPLCIPAITEEYFMKTLSGRRLKIDCDSTGVTVAGQKMRNEYILGNNGVIFVTSDVLVPNRAKSLLELAQAEHLTTFLELAKIGGFEESLSKFGDYTLFVPSEAAFAAIPDEVMKEIKSSPEAAQQFVRYHGTQGKIFTNKIKDSQLHMSLDEENTFRVLVYRKSVGVENSLIEKADIEGQNGVLHIINKVIRPSNISAGDLLRNEGNFTFFLKAMETTDAMDMSRALEGSGVDPLSSRSYTFFVPTDNAFQALGQTQLDALQNDPERLKRIIQNHIAHGLFSVESFKPELIYNLDCKFGNLSVFRTNETVKVNDASILKPDLMNANGVIHVINKVILQ